MYMQFACRVDYAIQNYLMIYANVHLTCLKLLLTVAVALCAVLQADAYHCIAYLCSGTRVITLCGTQTCL